MSTSSTRTFATTPLKASYSASRARSASSLSAFSCSHALKRSCTSKASSSSFLSPSSSSRTCRSRPSAVACCLLSDASSLACAAVLLSRPTSALVTACCSPETCSPSVSTLLFCARSLMPPTASTCSCRLASVASAAPTFFSPSPTRLPSALISFASSASRATSASLGWLAARALSSRFSRAARCAAAASSCIACLLCTVCARFASFCSSRASDCAAARSALTASSFEPSASICLRSLASSASLSPSLCAPPIRPRSGLPPPSIVPLGLMTTPSVVTTRHRLAPPIATSLASFLSPHTSVSCSAK
mmetsp:Transcript_32492/g.107443  ORF Transcript_32492/g.107443 Transcript_32492/m.107443 type:complete len:305 (-) Transcript_32492:884-1798(-)